MSDIKDAIQRMTQTREEIYSLVCEVLSVDTGERTCDVRPLNGQADIFAVRLQAYIGLDDGVVPIPAVGSNVVVTFLGRNHAYVALCAELDELLLHAPKVSLGGYNGEKAVLGETLNDNLAELNDNLGSLLTDLSTFATTQAAAATGVLLPLAAGYSALLTAITTLQATVASWEAKLEAHLSVTTTTE